MRHTIVILLSILLLVSYASAQSVSKELATQVALRYLNKNIDNSTRRLVRNQAGIDTTFTKIISPSNICPLYLVQFDEGWVLVSSELAAKPVLASSQSGRFPSEEEWPEGLKWLLSYYEREIQYAKDSLSDIQTDSRWYSNSLVEEDEIVPSSTAALPGRHIISEISAILWDQSGNNDGYVSSSNFYNKFCPTWYTPVNGHTYVGCTAVAIGIVMQYYKWPHSAIIPNAVDMDGNPSNSMHISTYNWSIMPNEIYNSTETIVVKEVASFLRDCGYACKMKYEENGSTASLRKAAEALEHNFHYESVTYHTRDRYLGNWLNKIKTEISQNRPVIYAGYYYTPTNSRAGHAFVLYGYNENNEFYINWGWRGRGNIGTYSIDNLVPRTSGVHSYNNEQEALWGIEPNIPSCTFSHSITTTEVANQNFEIYNNNTITGQNKTINNNHSGVIYSNQGVHLLPPFHICQGASVHIGIRDMHCNLSNNTTNAAMVPMHINLETNITNEDDLQNNQSISLSPNPVHNALKIEGCESLTPEQTIYSMHGQLVLRTIGTSINVSTLPRGIYLLICNDNSHIVQLKFIKE